MTPGFERSGFILVCITSVNADATAGPFRAPWCRVKCLLNGNYCA